MRRLQLSPEINALSTREMQLLRGCKNRNLSDAKGSISDTCRLHDPQSAKTVDVQETRSKKETLPSQKHAATQPCELVLATLPVHAVCER